MMLFLRPVTYPKLPSTKLVANDSMVQAAVEVPEEQDGTRDTVVSIDLRWILAAKRSHQPQWSCYSH